MIFNSYNIFLSLVSFSSELLLFWCFILLVIYLCFFYFNKLYTIAGPILCLLSFSFCIIFISNCFFPVLYSNLLGGTFYIGYLDILLRNIVVLLIFLILLVLFYGTVSVNSIVYSVEFIVLIYILTMSTIVVLYCNDLMSLFLFMELQSMVVYILICMRGEFSEISIGIRYFILGTLVSLVFLFNFSLLYYYTGISTFIDFTYLKLISSSYVMQYVVIGIYIFFLFKLYIFPFHFLGGELYRDSPINVLIFIASVLYYVYIYVFSKLVINFIGSVLVFEFLLGATLILCVFAILTQKGLLSFLGLGTSVHSVFILLFIFIDPYVNMSMIIFYILIYICTIIGILLFLYKFKFINMYYDSVCVMSNRTMAKLSIASRYCRISYVTISYIVNLSGLYKNYRYIAIYLSILLWSMAGLPPFSGFFTKFCVLSLCYIQSHLYILLFILLVSLVSSLYYVKVVKEFYYISSFSTYFSLLSDFDMLALVFIIYLCSIGIILPEFFIYLLY